MVWRQRRWRDSVGREGGREGGRKRRRNDIKFRASQICESMPRSSFPVRSFVRSFVASSSVLLPRSHSSPLLSSQVESLRGDGSHPTLILPCYFPKLPPQPQPSFRPCLPSFFFPRFGIIGLLLCPNFPQGKEGEEKMWVQTAAPFPSSLPSVKPVMVNVKEGATQI